MSRGKKATVRVRANGLVHGDGCVSASSVGDVLQPVIRRNSRNGEPKAGGVQVVEWTYLLVREQQEYTLDCDVYSSSRNPLAGRSSATVERMAVRVRPQAVANRVAPRDARRQPGNRWKDTKSSPRGRCPKMGVNRQAIQSDLDGPTGKVPFRFERIDLPMRLLYVKHGGHVLARLPLVPGLTPTAEAMSAER